VMSTLRSVWSSSRLWLVAIVLCAAVVRLVHIEWDANHFFHPDERAVAFAVQRLSFHPLRLDPDFFAYGSLPIYLTKITSSAVSLVDPWGATYDGVIVNGRRLSAVIGALTVLLLILLGRQLYDQSVGLLAGALLAACALHLQNSRFMTVDVTLTFVVLLALFALVRVATEGRLTHFVLAGIAIGLATATKFSAMPLFLPLGIASLHRVRVERRFAPVAARCALAVMAAVLAFVAAEPYGIIHFARFYHDILEQSRMVRNAGMFPYTTQYMGTPKYWYDLGHGTALGTGGGVGDGDTGAGGVARAPHRGVDLALLGDPVLPDHRLVRGEISALPAAHLSTHDPVGSGVVGAEIS
jgi:dolichyl-phosphate-mannose--protein O-mannosyl transferase